MSGIVEATFGILSLDLCNRWTPTKRCNYSASVNYPSDDWVFRCLDSPNPMIIARLHAATLNEIVSIALSPSQKEVFVPSELPISFNTHEDHGLLRRGQGVRVRQIFLYASHWVHSPIDSHHFQ